MALCIQREHAPAPNVPTQPAVSWVNGMIMAKDKKYKVGDHVRWNSEAGHVSGKIIKVHTSDFDYKGHTHRASEDEPQYEIKSDKTDHIAAHKGSALEKI